jgi:DNA-binding MarR family transcriptional regulator
MFNKWLKSEVNDVRSFNRIFNLSKLKGFDQDEEVQIGTMLIGGLREVTVKGQTFIMELKAANMDVLLKEDVNLKEKKVTQTVNLTEKSVFDYLLSKGGKSLYKDIREDLNLSRNVSSNTVILMKAKGIVKSTKLRDKNKNEMFELLEKDLSKFTLAGRGV